MTAKQRKAFERANKNWMLAKSDARHAAKVGTSNERAKAWSDLYDQEHPQPRKEDFAVCTK